MATLCFSLDHANNNFVEFKNRKNVYEKGNKTELVLVPFNPPEISLLSIYLQWIEGHLPG